MQLEKGGGSLHLISDYMYNTIRFEGPSLKRKAQFVFVYVDRKGRFELCMNGWIHS